MSVNERTILVLLLTVWGCSGCLGPHVIQSTRQDYNEVLHRTANEQLLLNLVRLRYRDSPSFLELGSLSTQYSIDRGASIEGTVFEAGRSAALLGGDASTGFSERPTATFAPLQGPEFVKRLVSPLTRETIILIARSGWSIDRVLRLTVQELNGIENARTASGPIPETAPGNFVEFQNIVRTLRRLQLEDQIEFGFERHADPLSEALPAELINGEHVVAAAREGWKFQNRFTEARINPDLIESRSGVPWEQIDRDEVEMLSEEIASNGLVEPLRVRWDAERNKFLVVDGQRKWAAVQLALENGMAHDDLLAIPCQVLHEGELVLSGTEESLIIRYDASLEQELASLSGTRRIRGHRSELPLSIEPRSLLGTMYFLSHAIEVPEEHARCGLAMFTRHEWGEPFDWNLVTGDLLRVSTSRRRPKCAAVAVEYRGYWFYIDDRDHDSKATFTLLMQLFELKAGGGATEAKPVLTLSVGG